MINWTYRGNPILSINDMPKDSIGFVYLLEFENNKKYIGKKYIYSTTTLLPLKNGIRRDNSILAHKIVNHKRVDVEIIKKESNWKHYNSSSKLVRTMIPIKRKILSFAFTKLQLTYLECKFLFVVDCLDRDDYLNDNILGRFFRSK